MTDEIEVHGPLFAMVPEWVLDEASDRAIALYCRLNRYANVHSHECWPSRTTLSLKLRCSVASVDRAIKELVKIGALEVLHRTDPDNPKRYLSSIFLLRFEGGGTLTGDGTPPLTGDGTPPLTGEGTLPSRVMRRTRVIEPEPKDKGLTPPLALSIVPDIPDSPLVSFDAFWSLYPRKAGKGAARKAWAKAIKLADPDDICSGATRFRLDPNREEEFTPHPATWLNQERWDDEALPARSGGSRHDPLDRGYDTPIDQLFNELGDA